MQGNGPPDHIPIWPTSFTPSLLLLISDLVHSYTGTNCASFRLQLQVSEASVQRGDSPSVTIRVS